MDTKKKKKKAAPARKAARATQKNTSKKKATRAPNNEPVQTPQQPRHRPELALQVGAKVEIIWNKVRGQAVVQALRQPTLAVQGGGHMFIATLHYCDSAVRTEKRLCFKA